MAFAFGSNAASSNTSQGTEQELANDIVLSNPPEDSISELSFSPQADVLSVASWDNKVRIYEVLATGQTEPRCMVQHDAPVLSTCWSADGTKVFSGSVDKSVKIYDIQSGSSQVIGTHDAPVKAVRFVEVGPSNTQAVVSGSWDKTLKYWDMRQPQPVATVAMPERVYAMDSAQKLLVTATAERHVIIMDLNNPTQIFKQTMSPLKWQTRALKCFPQGNGFALGSIEGRCSIQYVDEQEQSNLGFSFKCHRQQKTSPAREANVYALNAISFHPVHGTLSTAGSDGSFNFWDKDAKHRLKGYPVLGTPISATAFNRNGNIFAYALSYDWSKGHQFHVKDQPNTVKLHATKEEEIKPRPKRR